MGSLQETTWTGTAYVQGRASAKLLASNLELSFWGGVDPQTSEVIDRHHTLSGKHLQNTILAIPGGRGSCTGSGIMLELLLNGKAPEAIIFERREDILTLGVMIAEEVFQQSIPVLVLKKEDFRQLLKLDGQIIYVDDGHISTAPILSKHTDSARDPESGLILETAPALEGIKLSTLDQELFRGDYGEASRVAFRIVLRMAHLLGATRLMDITQVHVDGCVYTGPATLALAERLRDWGGKVRVPTTLNSISVDQKRWRALGVDTAFGEAADALGKAYVDMGAKPTYTCAPYQLESAPKLGEQVAWAESNAVVYANSVLGARTMKYPDFLDISIALTGRAPKGGPHIHANRLASVRVNVSGIENITDLDDSFPPLLGYYVGTLSTSRIPVLTGLESYGLSTDDLKAFGAAFATVSSAPMFHIVGVTPEATTLEAVVASEPTTFEVKPSDLVNSWDKLNSAPINQPLDLVSLGNPHFSLLEMRKLADPAAQDAGFTRPPMNKLLAAVSQSGKRPREPVLHQDAMKNPWTFPGPLVLPDDELAVEPDDDGQTFKEWLDMPSEDERNQVTTETKTIYVILPPTIPQDLEEMMKDWHKPVLPGSAQDLDKWTSSSPRVNDLIGYLRAFYHGMNVVQYQETFAWRPWNEKPKARSKTTKIGLETPGEPDVNLDDVADALLQRIPNDAFAVIMLTDYDLYEDEDDDFTVVVGASGFVLGPFGGAQKPIGGQDTITNDFTCDLPPVLTPKNDGLPDANSLFSSKEAFDTQVKRHQAIVRVPSICYDDLGDVDKDERWAPFYDLHDALAKTYPAIHKHAKLEKVNKFGLVYTIAGSDSSLKPYLLAAHQDVVPVPDPSTWTHPPFDAYFDGEWLWGRGSSDDKNSLTALMSAIETLLIKTEWSPKRTLILAFGFDEECSGPRGAAKIGELLTERYGDNGIPFILDEGGSGVQLIDDTLYVLPSVQEKGAIDIWAELRTKGGHSSIPHPHTGIGIMSEIVSALEANPYSPAIVKDSPVYNHLVCLARHSPDAHPKLNELLKKDDLDKLTTELIRLNPSAKFTVQTTQAVDIISGGQKINAMPEIVTLGVNYRVAPQDSHEKVQKQFLKSIDSVVSKYNLSVNAYEGDEKYHAFAGTVSETGYDYDGHLKLTAIRNSVVTPVSPTSGPIWDIFSGTMQHSFAFDGGKVVPVGEIMTGNTDTRHYLNLSPNIYRWTPSRQRGSENIHTVDERIRIDSHIDIVKFYYDLIRNFDAADF
ncbi:hypothetical protein HYE67_003257 [Fusarium culmorum]|uniref:Putative carboxypeptidase C24C9.08 n=1 Tax=Fusarium culmorum TaxID=5516 RepID=A0A2T4GKM6_FUSCU|nr:putative carboxypeptidase C24C9.08 [Fusarium culmorum]QPC61026.1 hypothetical protein HYE67_003257 [Fusarium culmorum]